VSLTAAARYGGADPAHAHAARWRSGPYAVTNLVGDMAEPPHKSIRTS
jgi:hypothetical protein